MTDVCFDLSGDHFAAACQRQQQQAEAGVQKHKHTSPVTPVVPRISSHRGEVFIPRGTNLDVFFGMEHK